MDDLKEKKKENEKPTLDIDVHIEDSTVDPGSGKKYVDLIIQSDDVALLESAVNMIRIDVTSDRTQEQKAQDFIEAAQNPDELVAALIQDTSSDKERNVGQLDPKESVAHGDIEKINKGMEVKTVRMEQTLLFENKSYKKQNMDTRSNKFQTKS